MRSNFFRCVDEDGKCPSHVPKPDRPYWVQYIQDRPVACNPYPGQTTVWDYRDNKLYALREGVADYLDRPLPLMRLDNYIVE